MAHPMKVKSVEVDNTKINENIEFPDGTTLTELLARIAYLEVQVNQLMGAELSRQDHRE